MAQTAPAAKRARMEEPQRAAAAAVPRNTGEHPAAAAPGGLPHTILVEGLPAHLTKSQVRPLCNLQSSPAAMPGDPCCFQDPCAGRDLPQCLAGDPTGLSG